MTGAPGARPFGRRASALDVVLGAALVGLWVLIATKNRPLAVDVRVLHALPPRSGHGSIRALSLLTRYVTDLGEPTTWTVTTLALAAVLAFALGSWVPMRLVFLPVLLEAVAVLGLKALVHRSGPPGEAHPRIFGYFPSGHTATALVCTGALATLIALWRPSWARWLRVAVLAWALLIAAALVYYRFHWVTDVVASLLLGLLILRLLCRPLWAPGAVAVRSDGDGGPPGMSGDDPAPEDDPLRLREDV